MAKTNAAFMSGVPELLILRVLSTQDMYGYQLVNAIQEQSSDTFMLAQGVVYPMLHTLEAKGLLKAQEKLSEGRKRIYYSITLRGKKRLAELVQSWEKISLGINQVLGREYEAVYV